MLSIYIVNIIGGMFFSWIFLFAGINNIENARSKMPYHIPNVLHLAAVQDELTSSGKRKPYQAVESNNHTHFVFKKDIPADMDGKDCRPQHTTEDALEKEEADIHKMRSLFHRLAILNQLSAPGNPKPKLDLIRKEYLEIYGEPEIRAVNSEKWLEGFADFFEDADF